MLREAADQHNMKLVSEVMDVSQIELVGRYADIYQVGARNMQNFTLLRELGRTRKPVLLKRGIAATIEEWLLSAEYILAGGNNDVILCERGIRTFESYTRNTLDISAIPVIKKLSHLPIITDPSHATGKRNKVAPMARASVAAGADGIIVEVHCNPDKALSDGAQSMFPAQFDRVMAELRIIAPAIGRSICVEPVVKRGWGRRVSDWRACLRDSSCRCCSPGESPGQPPIFQRVGIVGLGLIGGSIALAARQIWPAGLVIGVDRKDVLERAMVLHAIDVAADDPVVLAEADLVILAAPIQQNLEILRDAAGQRDRRRNRDRHRQHEARDRRGRRRRCRERLTFIGGHPLGGAARGGIEHARAGHVQRAGPGCSPPPRGTTPRRWRS